MTWANSYKTLNVTVNHGVYEGYDGEVIKLALEKTREEYGNYEIKPTRAGMNHQRIKSLMKNKSYPNLIYGFSYRNRKEEDNDLRYIHFPIDFGVLGYRVCFVSANKKMAIAATDNLAQLKAFTHIQGAGWADSRILSNAGFKVFESTYYSGMYNIINANRADLYCRGIGEIAEEYERYKYLVNLKLEESFAFYYPFPRYLMLHKDNELAHQRIKKGLDIAYNDGSLLKLWRRYYSASIDFSMLGSRKIYILENVKLKGMENTYQKYFDFLKLEIFSKKSH